jgi:hypothetical protein
MQAGRAHAVAREGCVQRVADREADGGWILNRQYFGCISKPTHREALGGWRTILIHCAALDA